MDSSDLRWWLLGFGSGVEVLEPLALREELTAREVKTEIGVEAQMMADRYNGPAVAAAR